MRRSLLLTLILLAAAPPAFAQVTVDLHALDALPNRPSTPALMPRATAPLPRPPHPPQQSAAAPTPTPGPTPPAAPAPAAAPTPAPPTATLPAAPPPVATINPVPPPPPTTKAPAPPPPPVVATATTTATRQPAGLQLTFAGGESDLSPDSAAAIRQLVQATPTGGNTTYNVRAYAAGVANDPSMPRRLSLARAIAVRAALVDDGVPSANIYLLALGAQGGNGPPDRVDIEVLGANAPASGLPPGPKSP